MAIVGLKMVTVGLVDPTTQELIVGTTNGLSTTGIIEIDDKMLGTKTANITALEGSIQKVNGNNNVQDVMIAPGNPQIAFDFNNLDFDIKQKMLGFVSDRKGGWTPSLKKPHVAVLIESENIQRTESLYFGFANGIMQETTQNVATDTDTAQTRNDDNMTYVSLAAKAFGGESYKKYRSGATGFTKVNMLSEVLGGFTAAP